MLARIIDADTEAIGSIPQRIWARLPFGLLFMGIISIVLIIISYRINAGMRQCDLHIDSVREAEIEISRAHLALEDKNRGIQGLNDKDAYQMISLAEESVSKTLNGGTTAHGYKMNPLHDAAIREDVESLLALIKKFRKVSESISAGRAVSDLNSIDRVYDQILSKASAVEESLDVRQSESERRSKKLIISLIIFWIFIVTGTIAGFLHRDQIERRMHAAILNAKHQWERTFDVIPDLIAVIDKDHNVIRSNKAMSDRMGLGHKDILGKKCYEVFHNASEPVQFCPHILLLQDNKPHVAEIYEKKFDAFFLVSVTPLLDDSGAFLGSVHVARDITAQKKVAEEIEGYRNRLEELVDQRTTELAETNNRLKAEMQVSSQISESLQQSELRFRKLSQEFNILLDAIPDSIVLISPDLKVKWANRSANQTLMTPDGRVFDNCCQLMQKREKPCSGCPVIKSFQTGKPEISQVSTPDGRLWEVRAFPLRNDKGEVESVMELKTDITEKVRMQEEQMRTNHLASIGELAAGVAHEINNPINGIINFAQIILNRADEKSRDYDIAGRIIKEGERIAFIVSGLLSFARQGREEPVLMQIEQILADALSLTETQLRKNGIQMSISAARDVPPVMIRPQQIQQVFLNIINNARYALNQKYPEPSPGKILLISIGETRLNGEMFARIIFEDHGAGIAGDIIGKIMNPFFSTKPAGQGTGLGLSISHGIIVDHRGSLSVESEEGEFTRITVTLPAYTENG